MLNILAGIIYKFGDLIIVIFAAVNIFVFCTTKTKIKQFKETLYPSVDKVNQVSPSMRWDNDGISKLEKRREELISWYTGYANLTAIFPLLGILGTVAALVTYSDVTMIDNFMLALSTTLWGVFFAVIFKVFDTFLSAPIDVIIEDTDHVIQEHRREERRKNEA